MKVGTDGVLLGAWAPHPNPKHILDIGTGTGLIALMMAQRFPEALITAIEPDEAAIQDAAENFGRESLGKHIRLIQSDLESFAPTQPFDLIVSNPPFFLHSLPSTHPGRTSARHIQSFGPGQLVEAGTWLNENGVLAGIYPIDTFLQMEAKAAKRGFHLNQKCEVRPNPNKKPHRMLFSFSKIPHYPMGSEYGTIVIETGERHIYTPEYRALTGEFYLDRAFSV